MILFIDQDGNAIEQFEDVKPGNMCCISGHHTLFRKHDQLIRQIKHGQELVATIISISEADGVLYQQLRSKLQLLGSKLYEIDCLLDDAYVYSLFYTPDEHETKKEQHGNDD